MRLTEISVTKLFGIFDHVVALNLDDRITIIHAPNGFGKTMLLRMVNSLLSGSYTDFLTIPFQEFKVSFDDPTCSLSVTIPERPQLREHLRRAVNRDVTLHYKVPGRPEETYNAGPPTDIRELEFLASTIEREVPEVERVAPRFWRQVRSGERLSLQDVVARYSEGLSLRYRLPGQEPEWLRQVQEQCSIRFIETQRLQIVGPATRSTNYQDRPSIVHSVAEYSADLAKAIQATLAEYASRSQSLDRTFPKRVLSHNAPSNVTVDKLRSDLNDLESRRLDLVEAGLINPEGELDFQVPERIEEGIRNLLDVYVDDANSKLSVLDDIALRIEVLKRSINARFLFKSISISRERGFTLTTSDGKSIEPVSLSSGEQHELVLIYELLFKAGKNSIILIDEPEISLHVAWQHEFLKDLKQIAELSSLDVVIATHSPQIIGSRWDLAVELRGPE